MNEIILTEENLLPAEVEAEIAQLEKQIALLKKKDEEIKERLKELMLERGLVKIDSDDLMITYVAPTTREQFDSKTFRKEYPDLYDEYVKITSVKEYVKVVAK